MSIYSGYLTENMDLMVKEEAISNFNFDMYDFISQETINLKNMLAESIEDKTLLENQIALLEAFDIKVFAKNIIVKVKELLKKLLAKIQQLSTEFANKKYINYWKNTKIDKETLGKQLYYATNKYLNNTDKEGVYISFIMNKDLNIKDAMEKFDKLINDINTDNLEEYDDFIYKNIFDLSDECFVKIANSPEEFIKINSKSIDFIMNNKNNIIKVLKGEFLLKAKKSLISIESEFEKAINRKVGDIKEIADKLIIGKLQKAIIETMKEVANQSMGDFRFYLRLTSLCLKAEGENYEAGEKDYQDDDEVYKNIHKTQNNFDK